MQNESTNLATHKNGTSNGNTVDYHLKPKVLVYGARGWVGQQLIEELEKNGEFDIVEVIVTKNSRNFWNLILRYCSEYVS